MRSSAGCPRGTYRLYQQLAGTAKGANDSSSTRNTTAVNPSRSQSIAKRHRPTHQKKTQNKCLALLVFDHITSHDITSFRVVVQEVDEALVVQLGRNAGDLVPIVRQRLPEGLGMLAGVVLLHTPDQIQGGTAETTSGARGGIG